MQIRIDARSRIPPFEQLRAQLALGVASGRLRPGERLPPIRGLADRLALSPGTVARAYRELEQAGIVEGRGRRGTFVTAEPPVAHDVVQRQQRITEAATEYVACIRELGVSDRDALEAVATALK